MNEDKKIARAKAFEQLDKVYFEPQTFRRLLAKVNAKGIEIGGIGKAVEGLIFAPDAKSIGHYAPENTMVIIRAFT